MFSSRAGRTTVVLVTSTTLIAAACGVARANASKPPEPFRSTSIVVQKSEGGIALGASEATTEKIFGASNCTITPTGGGCGVSESHNSYTVYAGFGVKSKKVNQVTFQSQSLAKPAQAMHTNKKIHIGCTLTQLRKAYPKVKKSRGPGTARYYSLSSGRTGTQFVLNNKNRVYEIDLFTS